MPKTKEATFPILITSVPKSGTHLITKVVGAALHRQPLPLHKALLPKVPELDAVMQAFHLRELLFHGHIRFSHSDLFKPYWKFIVQIRDPRDVILSMRDFIFKTGDPDHEQAKQLLEKMEPDDQLIALLEGLRTPTFNVPPIDKMFSGFVKWQRRGALLVRFEDLVAGTSAQDLADFLHCDLETVAEAIHASVGSSSKTLNKGVAFRWRTDMSGKVLDVFNRCSAGMHLALGYSD